MTETKTGPAPVACTLPAVEQRARRAELRGGLLREIRGVREVDGGFALEFAPAAERVERLGAFIAFESECCPFLDFALRVPREGGPVELCITGPSEAQSFLRDELLGARASAPR
jgi:hypothetical protein